MYLSVWRDSEYGMDRYWQVYICISPLEWLLSIHSGLRATTSIFTFYLRPSLVLPDRTGASLTSE